MSFYCLHSPKKVSEYSVLGLYSFSGEQNLHVYMLYLEALRFVRLRPEVPKGPGRGTFTMLNLLKQCEASSFDGNIPTLDSQFVSTTALPIEFDKLVATLPVSVAHFQPELHFPND